MLAVVAVAALAGWWATGVAGLVVTGLYWWYGVPAARSFRLRHPVDVVAVASMAVLTLGVAAMARRVERSVNDVRALAQVRRAQVESELSMRRQAETTAAEIAAVMALSNALAPEHTVAHVAEIIVDQIRLPAPPTGASVAVVRGQHLKILAARGARPSTIRALEAVDVTETGWLAEALAGRSRLRRRPGRVRRGHPGRRCAPHLPERVVGGGPVPLRPHGRAPVAVLPRA